MRSLSSGSGLRSFAESYLDAQQHLVRFLHDTEPVRRDRFRLRSQSVGAFPARSGNQVLNVLFQNAVNRFLYLDVVRIKTIFFVVESHIIRNERAYRLNAVRSQSELLVLQFENGQVLGFGFSIYQRRRHGRSWLDDPEARV